MTEREKYARGSRKRSLLLAFSIAQCLTSPADSFLPHQHRRSPHRPRESLHVALSSYEWQETNGRRRKKYQRKDIPESEKQARRLRKERQKEFDEMSAKGTPSIWSFESLFPEPIRDEQTVYRDLYEVKDRDSKRGEPSRKGLVKPSDDAQIIEALGPPKLSATTSEESSRQNIMNKKTAKQTTGTVGNDAQSLPNKSGRVNRELTRMVEDKIFGIRRTENGEFEYETSLMGDGAVKFRDGVRLGNPLKANADLLNYWGKKELRNGRVDEAKELYEEAVAIDPRDGRAYLGLSKCAERRRDFKLSEEYLKAGIKAAKQEYGDKGANPFLLQAYGVLLEKKGFLSKAEEYYIAATKSRPSHAAAWISLAQLRTRKLGMSTAEGRNCFQRAENELSYAGKPPSSFVYTAWADLEFKRGGDKNKARELLSKALKIDPKCSAAWLQLGVIERESDQWDEAEECFQSVLKFDKRNSRVLQAYALSESRRPQGSSRKTVDLFERALNANPRDAGVLQAYALYVNTLGDVSAARSLFKRGIDVNKRSAATWQAWGVLETREGNFVEARNIFQQGIWECAQMSGNQSGGHHCARLWQAWGVLESRVSDDAAARRCFSRALDADGRNVPTVTAWAQMEESLGNDSDARSVYERALPKFSPGSDEKMVLWRNYELMEERIGDAVSARNVYQRRMRETLTIEDETFDEKEVKAEKPLNSTAKSREIEVSRWREGQGEVWMNGNAIESKMPAWGRRKPQK